MKKYLWITVAGALFLPMASEAQYQLPPGTRVPDDPASSSSARAAGQPRAAAQDPGLAEAEDRIDQADFEGARPLIEKYVSQHQSDARALFDLGYVNQAENREDAAVQEYKQAIAADPKQFESRLALGLILAREGKRDKAREELLQASLLAPSPANPAAQAQAFRALAALDRISDPEAARDELLSALKLSPETPKDLLLTAQIAEATGDSTTSEAAYRRLLANYPQSALASSATAGLTHILLQNQKYDDAEPLLESALQRDPDDSALNAQLATTLIAQGKSNDAMPVLEKLHQLEPKNAAVNQMLADAYTQAGHPEKADPIYAAMAVERPNDPAILSEQGRNLILEKRYREAQEVLERSVKLKPDDGDAWSSLAFAATQNDQYSMALEALSMRAKYLEETASSYFLRAISYDNLHQAKTAEEYYRKFLAAAGGKFPDQEWQANQRLAILGRSH